MMSGPVQSDPPGYETLETFSQAGAFNRWLYQKIVVYIQGKTIEIGSGIGNISTFLLKDIDDVTLTDLRPEYCRILQKKFSCNTHLRGVYELDLSSENFESKHPVLIEKFDTVVALNVIEHIKDDLLAIRNAKALLKKSGKLVILVPAGQYLYNSIDRELGHNKRYSKSSLIGLMESTGLVVTNCRYFNAAAILGWWVTGNVLREKTISSARLNIYDHMVPLFKFSDWFISPFTGISLISVGHKN